MDDIGDIEVGGPEVRQMLGTLAAEPPRAVDLVPGVLGRYDGYRRRARWAAVAGSTLAVAGTVGIAGVVVAGASPRGADRAGAVGAAASTTASTTASGPVTSGSAASGDGSTVTVGDFYAKARSCPADMIDLPGPQRIATQNPGGAAGDRQLCLTQSAVLRTMFPGAAVYPILGFGPIPSLTSSPDPNNTFYKEGMAYRLPKNTFVSIEIGKYRVVSGAKEIDLNIQYTVPGATDLPTGTECWNGSHGARVALASGLTGAYCAEEAAVLLHGDVPAHSVDVSVEPPLYGQRLDPGFDLPGFVKDPRVAATLLSGMHEYYGF